MLHVLGVDENLERADAAAVVHQIVDGDVERVVAFRPAHLVGFARYLARTVERLEHVMHDAAGLLARRVEPTVKRQLGGLGFSVLLVA